MTSGARLSAPSSPQTRPRSRPIHRADRLGKGISIPKFEERLVSIFIPSKDYLFPCNWYFEGKQSIINLIYLLPPNSQA